VARLLGHNESGEEFGSGKRLLNEIRLDQSQVAVEEREMMKRVMEIDSQRG